MYKLKIKKYIASILALVTVVACLSVGVAAFGDDTVAINEANFPDPVFREIVSKKYDKNSDGVLQLSEREVSSLTVSAFHDSLYPNTTIESIKGIEYFTSATSLYAADIGLKELDLSKNTKLVLVRCGGNPIETLTLGSLPSLVDLNCRGGMLTTINLSGCPKLKKLNLDTNKLTSINLSSNTALTALSLYQNELTSLDLSANTSLRSLSCSNNHIPELDLSANTSLRGVTEQDIGNQWINASAYLSGNSVYIGKAFKNVSNLVSSTLDTVYQTDEGESRQLAYKNNVFYTDELDNLSGKLTDINQKKRDGFTYRYNVNNAECENMSVNVAVSRDVYQVNFYTDETKTERISYAFIRRGSSAVAPATPEAPTCKKFVSWSEDYSNVLCDLDVYAVWEDDHNIVKSFDSESGDIDIHCTKCDTVNYKFNFLETCNKRKGEAGFNELADINKDGVVNAKDYAIFTMM